MKGVKRDFEEVKKTVLDMRSEMTSSFGTILELLGNKQAKLVIEKETKTGENEDKSEDRINLDVVPDWELIVSKNIKNKKITPMSHLLCHWLFMMQRNITRKRTAQALRMEF